MQEIKCVKTGLDVLTPYFGMRADLFISACTGRYIAKGYKNHSITIDNHDQYFAQVDAGEIIDDRGDFIIIHFERRFAAFSDELREFIEKNS